ncbi:MAG: hypothetical protein O3A47_05515 [Chloroflexi bacterium]|nr:hypothetical protein [Chloroflexota bacterium]
MAKTYQTPDSLVDLLDGSVRAAARTAFYGPSVARIQDISDFEQVPITPLSIYRRQRLPDLLADPSRVEWIAGPLGGQSEDGVAVAEGPDETGTRYEVLEDAVRAGLGAEPAVTAVVVTSGRRRQFAAEVATILTRSGIPAHLLPNASPARTREFLSITGPQVIVVLSDDLAEDALPSTARLCVTFRQSHRMGRVPQIDLYVLDEIGFMAQSADLESYIPNRDVFHFERSDDGFLVVTSLYNHVRPVIRIKTEDRIESVGPSLRFVELSRSG